MKNYIIIALVFCAQIVFGQQDLASRHKFKINNQVSYGDSKATVINALGNPTREENAYNEIDEIDVVIMYYGLSEIYIEEGKLNSFEIKDTSLFVSYENVTISIDGNISVLQGLFPSSYNARGSNVSEYGINPGVAMVLTAITTGTEERPIDEYVRVFFHPNTLKITGIRHGSW